MSAMCKVWKGFVPALFVLSFAFSGASAKAQQSVSTSTGGADAPVSVLMFVDLECPFSAATVPMAEKLLSQYPHKVRLELRQFPLEQHEHARLAHEAALAAGAQGKYLQMVDLIQANQTRMDRAQYLGYAHLLRLDMTRFTHDLDTHRFAAQVQTDLALGRALGIDTTPTIFLNGQRLTGVQDMPSLNAAVAQAVAEPGKAVVAASSSDPPLSAADIALLTKDPVATMGSADAPVTVVEFTDFQCPFCRRASEPLHQLLAQSGGSVRWVYRSYPLDFHEHAAEAAEVALAAGDQGKFWPMHDLLFANQANLDREHFDQFARQLGLDVAKFDQDLTSGRFRARVAADRALGQKYGVDGTPAFFINGRYISGVRTLPEFQQAVVLAKNDAQPAANLSAAAPTQHLIEDGHRGAAEIAWFIDVEAVAAPASGSTLHELAAAHPVSIAIHNYALPSHPNAALAYRALLEASKEGHFWALYDTLAGRALPQDNKSARAVIVEAAKTAGVEAGKVEAAFDDPSLTADLEADKQEAYRRGVRGVPVIFVGSQRIDGVQAKSVYEHYVVAATPVTASATAHSR